MKQMSTIVVVVVVVVDSRQLKYPHHEDTVMTLRLVFHCPSSLATPLETHAVVRAWEGVRTKGGGGAMDARLAGVSRADKCMLRAP